MTELVDSSWYRALIDECGAIITEAHFVSNWALIEGYHQLGIRLLEEYDNFERAGIYGKEIVSYVSHSLGKSKRTIWRSIQFAKKYPNLNSLPEGKDTSWYKICNKYLPESKEDKKESKEEPLICPHCKKKLPENFGS